MRPLLPIMALLSLVLSGPMVFAGEHSVKEIEELIESSVQGEIVRIPPGIYQGNLVISKPVIIDGHGDVTIDGMGNGTVVSISAPDVTIRGMTIRGSGSQVNGEPAGLIATAGQLVIEDNRFVDVYFGIDLRQSPDSVIRNNVIHGKDFKLGRRGDGLRLWWSHGCTIENNIVQGMRDMVFWYSENLTISNNQVSDSRYGLHFMYSHHTTLSGNQLENNSVGIYLMYSNSIALRNNRVMNNRGTSGYGIGLKDCDDIIVEQNALLANRVGVYIDNSPSSVDSQGLIRMNSISFNEIGLLATPITHDNVIYENAFIENEEQAAVHGGGRLILNRFSEGGVGNFWSDYSGFDLENDGIGDMPYAPRSLFRNLLAREPNLRLFVHSPAQQAIELTSRAFPDLSPEPMFSDPDPLSRVPDLHLPRTHSRISRVPMVIASVFLLLSSIAVIVFWSRQPALVPLHTSGSTSS